MELLVIGAVAGHSQRVFPVERLQQLHSAGHGDGTVVQGGAEVFLEHRAVKVDVQRGEHVVPADAFQLRERQRSLLDPPPQLSVFPVEYLLHIRLIGLQPEVGEALPHGLTDVLVKVQQRIVNVDEYKLHGIPHRKNFRCSDRRRGLLTAMTSSMAPSTTPTASG